MRQVAVVVRVEVHVDRAKHGEQQAEPPVAQQQDGDADDPGDEEDDVRQRQDVVDDPGHRRRRRADALGRQEVHGAAELGAADMGEEAIPGQERPVHVGRAERCPDRDLQVRHQPEHERAAGPDEQPGVPNELAPRIDER